MIDETCNGPIDSATGICRWCDHHHEPTGQREMDDGALVGVYEPQCKRAWPDRPRKDVAPKFATAPVRFIKFECWHCRTESVFNSLMTPSVFMIMDQDETLFAHCNHCGSGMDVRKAQIMSLADGRAILNRQVNRHQRRADAAQRRKR